MINAEFREFAGFLLDAAEKELWYCGERVALSPKEAQILCMLAERPGRLVTKDEIVGAVWPDSFVEESNLSRQIYMLRRRLTELGAPPDLIENVPRRGYRLNAAALHSAEEGIVERHTFSQTLIEEIHSSVDSPHAAESQRTIQARAYLALAAMACFTVLAGIALAAWQTSAERQPVSVAVLPFNVIGASGDDRQSGAAVADLLITRLSGIRELTVRPTSAVIGFDAETPSVDLGQRLGVDSVIEGTILETAEGRRVTVRMLGVPDGEAIWSGEFTVNDSGLFSVHDEIAGRIIDAVFSRRNTAQAVAARGRLAANETALRLYLEARYHWNKRNSEGMGRAEFLFQKAIETDPGFTLAKVGLAESLMMGYQASRAQELLKEAEIAEPELSEIYAARGFIALFHARDGAAAELNFKRAIELNANNASGHQWYATLLTVQGRFSEARTALQRAIEIDPLSANYLADLAQTHFFAGEYEAAENVARRALELQPNSAMAYRLLADVHIERGEIEKWIESEAMAHATLAASDPDRIAMISAEFRNRLVERFDRGGLRAAEGIFIEDAEIDNNPNRYIGRAKVLARRGELELAVADLERALDGKAFLMPFVKADPAFAPLREDARFKSIVSRIGL